MNRHARKTMKDILKDFNPKRKRNDRFLVSKMRQSGGARRRNDAYNHQGNVRRVLLGDFIRLKIGSYSEEDGPIQKIKKIVYATFLSPKKEGHRALGRDATLSSSRVLTHPPRCNRTRHREVTDLMAAILERTS